MKRASVKLFDLVYGELIPVESKIFGKMVFIFYTIDDQLRPQIVYYPSTKEIKIHSTSKRRIHYTIF